MNYKVEQNGCFWVITQYHGDVLLAQFQTRGNIHDKIMAIEKLWNSMSPEEQKKIINDKEIK